MDTTKEHLEDIHSQEVESAEALSLTSNLRTSVSSPSQGQDQSLSMCQVTEVT